MATLKIPVRVVPKAYTMTLELDGLYLDLSFRFNARDDHWFVSVGKNGVLLLSGVKVVHSEDLFAQFEHFKADNRLPPGTFRVFDVTGDGRDPDVENFGDGVVMLYVEAA